MPRSALAPSRNASRSRGPRAAHESVPALSVLVGSTLSLLPIVSSHGWWPSLGLLMLIAWRLHRADAWPAWVAAPLGLWNDLMTAAPIGLSVALWTFFMLAMDIVDRRTMWRDYWIEWAVATALIALAELAQWRVAALAGAPVPFAVQWPAIIVASLCFPIAAWLVSRLDRWRLGK